MKIKFRILETILASIVYFIIFPVTNGISTLQKNELSVQSLNGGNSDYVAMEVGNQFFNGVGLLMTFAYISLLLLIWWKPVTVEFKKFMKSL